MSCVASSLLVLCALFIIGATLTALQHFIVKKVPPPVRSFSVFEYISENILVFSIVRGEHMSKLTHADT